MDGYFRSNIFVGVVGTTDLSPSKRDNPEHPESCLFQISEKIFSMFDSNASALNRCARDEAAEDRLWRS